MIVKKQHLSYLLYLGHKIPLIMLVKGSSQSAHTETRMMFIKHYAPNRCLYIKVANSIDHWVEDCRDVTKAGGGGDMYKEWKL